MFFTLQTSLILSVFFVILIFVGFALGQYSFNTMVPLVLRSNRVGMGTGFYQLNNFVGVSVGPAIFTRLMIVNGGTKWGYVLCACLSLGVAIYFWHHMKN